MFSWSRKSGSTFNTMAFSRRPSPCSSSLFIYLYWHHPFYGCVQARPFSLDAFVSPAPIAVLHPHNDKFPNLNPSRSAFVHIDLFLILCPHLPVFITLSFVFPFNPSLLFCLCFRPLHSLPSISLSSYFISYPFRLSILTPLLCPRVIGILFPPFFLRHIQFSISVAILSSHHSFSP